MPNYDFDYFISTIKHLDHQDIVVTAEQRLSKLPEKVKKGEVVDFGQKVKGLLYWLHTGKKPKLFGVPDIEKLKAVGESLVSKRQMEASTLAHLNM